MVSFPLAVHAAPFGSGSGGDRSRLRGFRSKALQGLCSHCRDHRSSNRIGGEFVQCEADEVCFRCKAGCDSHGEPCLWWMRFIMICHRGSRKSFLEPLEDRPVHGAGQGGGGAKTSVQTKSRVFSNLPPDFRMFGSWILRGALSVDELVKVLMLSPGEPRLLPRSILHTDSAKAYRHVGPMHWSTPPGIQV